MPLIDCSHGCFLLRSKHVDCMKVDATELKC